MVRFVRVEKKGLIRFRKKKKTARRLGGEKEAEGEKKGRESPRRALRPAKGKSLTQSSRKGGEGE